MQANVDFQRALTQSVQRLDLEPSAEFEGWFVLYTGHTNPNGDLLEIFVRARERGSFELSDQGKTRRYIERWRGELKPELYRPTGQPISELGGALVTSADRDNLWNRITSMIATMYYAYGLTAEQHRARISGT